MSAALAQASLDQGGYGELLNGAGAQVEQDEQHRQHADHGGEQAYAACCCGRACVLFVGRPGDPVNATAWYRYQQQRGYPEYRARRQGCPRAERRGDAEKYGWGNGRTEETGKGMNRERPPQACGLDAVGQQRIVARVIHTIGQASHGQRHQQYRVTGAGRQQHKAEAAQQQPGLEHFTCTIVVHSVTQRGLHQRGDDVEHCQGYAQLYEAHAQQAGQHRQQRRDQHDVHMADEVHGSNLGQQLGARVEHVDNLLSRVRHWRTARWWKARLVGGAPQTGQAAVQYNMGQQTNDQAPESPANAEQADVGRRRQEGDQC